MKNSQIEEQADKIYPFQPNMSSINKVLLCNQRLAFIRGAKWIQENTKTPIFERYYKCHNGWFEIKPRGWIVFLKEEVKHKNYIYYKPINGIRYRREI